MVRFSLLLFLLLPFIGKAQVYQLDSLMMYYRQSGKLYGSVVITKNGKTQYISTAGALKTDNKQPINPQTSFRIGSISKTFTACMVFQLVDEKKLSLDQTLATWFPGMRNADKIRLRHLLAHQSGIFNLTERPDYPQWFFKPKSEKEMIAMIESFTPVFEPGEQTQYSNTNYYLLGKILEKVEGERYEKILKRRITDRLGLTRTSLAKGYQKNEAHSYLWDGQKWEEHPSTAVEIPGGAGGIRSTPADLAKFMTFLLQGQLLSSASLDSMKEIGDKNLGKGLVRVPFYDRKALGHTGTIDGFHSAAFYFPDDSVSIAYCLSADNVGSNAFALAILSLYYKKPFEIPVWDSVRANYAVPTYWQGQYTSTQIPLGIRLKVENGKLSAQADGQSSFFLEPKTDRVFEYYAAGIRIEFEAHQEGVPNKFTLFQGGMEYRFEQKKP